MSWRYRSSIVGIASIGWLLGTGCSADRAIATTEFDGGVPAAPYDTGVPGRPRDSGRGTAPFAEPCNRITGLWRIQADTGVSSFAKRATTYLIDFDARRIVANVPLLYDATAREWTSDVDPALLPGRLTCADLGRYGVVMLFWDSSDQYLDPTTSFDLSVGGSWSQGGCTATVGVFAPAESQVELFAWDPTGDILTAPSPMTAPDGGANRRFTVRVDPLPLCGTVPDVIYISAARVQGKVVAMYVHGSFAVR